MMCHRSQSLPCPEPIYLEESIVSSDPVGFFTMRARHACRATCLVMIEDQRPVHKPSKRGDLQSVKCTVVFSVRIERIFRRLSWIETSFEWLEVCAAV